MKNEAETLIFLYFYVCISECVCVCVGYYVRCAVVVVDAVVAIYPARYIEHNVII